MEKIFVRIGPYIINVNAIALVTPADDGLRIITTVRRKDGSSVSFLVPPGASTEELKNLLYPYIAVFGDEVSIEAEVR
jgi:hypothetical protein